MNVTDRRIDPDLGGLAQPGLEGAPVGGRRDGARQIARGVGVLGDSALKVVSTMDLEKLMSMLGIDYGEERRDLLQQRLAGVLTMMLGQMQIADARQLEILKSLAEWEKKLDELKILRDAAVRGLESDPLVVAMQIEIEKLNRIINSMKTTPEERAKALREKAALEKRRDARLRELEAKSAEIQKIDKAISAVRATQAGLVRQLSTDGIRALFSALSAMTSMARKALAENPADGNPAQLLDGAEQLAILLGETRPDEMARFNQMVDELAARRSETAYA